MQVIQAGEHKLLLLELDVQILENIARQLGFEARIEETARVVTLELRASERESPLLLFDATDPGNLGWFSRCQFYVDAVTGNVLQTPFKIGNVRERNGRVRSRSVRIQISKELPAKFRMPGRQPVNEQAMYAVLYNLLGALMEVGVAVCGTGVVQPVAGRGEGPRART
ncbi:MAG: hypothetical protein SFV18_05965 [Bryobacteraceae bacterium]|jgi:hypothetical protein|nr:hypothetical protein [Bryobacteraceae bacterium]